MLRQGPGFFAFMEQTETVTPSTPAPLPITSAELTFREQRDLTRAGKEFVESLAPSPSTPAVDDSAEADSTKPDAALSEAARVLRKNRADERKAKIQTEINELTAAKHRERAELEALRRERAGLGHSPAEARPAAPAVDPADLEPTLDSVTAQHPDDPDPYARWQREVARWDRRQEQNQEFAQRQRATVAQSQDQAVSGFHARAAEFKAAHTDYDAVFEGLVQAVAGNPREKDITVALVSQGPALAYHLAKHRSELDALLTAPSPRDLIEAIGVLKHRVAAAQTVAPPIPSTAPAPHQPTAASGTTVTPPKDENDMTTTEFLRHKRAQRLAARSA